MRLPNEGMSPEAIFSHLDELKHDDVRWREGRAFSLVYYGGADVLAVAEEAYRRYSTENALNTDAFPGLRTVQAEVVGFVSEWLEAGDEGAGFMTSGGTESILMAVKSASERGRRPAQPRRPRDRHVRRRRHSRRTARSQRGRTSIGERRPQGRHMPRCLDGVRELSHSVLAGGRSGRRT